MSPTEVVEEFVLGHGTQLRFSGAVPRDLVGYDGCQYRVQLTGGGVEASEVVYDVQPQRWSDLFEGLAKHWRGWQGTKEHQSLEQQLEISCTCDRTGHVVLRVTLRGHRSGSDWLAVDNVYLEAGQLEEIAARARAYFG